MRWLGVAGVAGVAGMLETAHLLRSPKNAKRLFTALDRVKAKDSGSPQTIEELRNEVVSCDEGIAD